MQRRILLHATGIGLLTMVPLSWAQAPSRGAGRTSNGPEALVNRVMAFDKNGDGKLTKTELDDERLHRLFDRADADGDGNVTRAEVTALAEKETAARAAANSDDDGPGFGPPPGGPGGPGFGPGGPGGPGGPPGGGFRPGQVLPPFLADALELTDEQQAQLDALQKDVDGRLAKILTDEQKKTLDQMRQGPGRGPGGPGFGPGGRGGRGGGPGGPGRRAS